MDIAFIISGSGFVLSLVTTVGIVSLYLGRMQERISNLRTAMAAMATKEEVSAMRSDLSEIKGMFRLTLKDGG